ncbi:PilW family protein [Paucibacter sp. XJ19-41]|uniref:PilW family protein n=1 Tax=Paucibacter sp. XJ19-41 TaxID=2927824 RepID=UPI0023496B3A|nr:PilW family protein [Paucibacter sp. XJ19-41]MDC6166069.1 PilW family protein [Paucibacter sp. XJ19-41]
MNSMTNSRMASIGKPLRGFSLIEVIVGMAIGLLCTLVIATVLSSVEGQRRGTTQGSDAQVNGTLALYSVQREVAMAGYGFASEAPAVGCTLQAMYNNAAVTALPPRLAPVMITQGADGRSDTLRVLASSKFIDGNAATRHDIGYTVPTRVLSTYDPNDLGPTRAYQYQVSSLLSIVQGDLMVAVIDAATPCGLFQVTGVQDHATMGRLVLRADDSPKWNAPRHPAQVANNGAFLVNLGRVSDVSFTVDANQRLMRSELNTRSMSRIENAVQSNIVLLKAMYGRDTDGNLTVDTYDYTTPTTNAGWLSVLTVRLVVVARSAQYEKDKVTTKAPQWDVGASASVSGAVACGTSKCVELKVDTQDDWEHYRYQIFDTVIPLRNQRWKAGGS